MLINVEFEVLTLRHPANNQDIDSTKLLLSYIGHELSYIHMYLLRYLLDARVSQTITKVVNVQTGKLLLATSFSG